MGTGGNLLILKRYSGVHAPLTLLVGDPAVPVVQTNEIKTYLRDQAKQRGISAERRKQLVDILAGGAKAE